MGPVWNVMGDICRTLLKYSDLLPGYTNIRLPLGHEVRRLDYARTLVDICICKYNLRLMKSGQYTGVTHRLSKCMYICLFIYIHMYIAGHHVLSYETTWRDITNCWVNSRVDLFLNNSLFRVIKQGTLRVVTSLRLCTHLVIVQGLRPILRHLTPYHIIWRARFPWQNVIK